MSSHILLFEPNTHSRSVVSNFSLTSGSLHITLTTYKHFTTLFRSEFGCRMQLLLVTKLVVYRMRSSTQNRSDNCILLQCACGLRLTESVQCSNLAKQSRPAFIAQCTELHSHYFYAFLCLATAEFLTQE